MVLHCLNVAATTFLCLGARCTFSGFESWEETLLDLILGDTHRSNGPCTGWTMKLRSLFRESWVRWMGPCTSCVGGFCSLLAKCHFYLFVWMNLKRLSGWQGLVRTLKAAASSGSGVPRSMISCLTLKWTPSVRWMSHKLTQINTLNRITENNGGRVPRLCVWAHWDVGAESRSKQLFCQERIRSYTKKKFCNVLRRILPASLNSLFFSSYFFIHRNGDVHVREGGLYFQMQICTTEKP